MADAQIDRTKQNIREVHRRGMKVRRVAKSPSIKHGGFIVVDELAIVADDEIVLFALTLWPDARFVQMEVVSTDSSVVAPSSATRAITLTE